MKRAILILVVLLLISTGVVYSQASITGKVDVDVDIENAFSDKPTTFSTAAGDTEVDIKATIADYSSITVQFRGIDAGGGINSGDVFLESDIIGAFGWSDSIPELLLKIKGGVFNPEPSEKGEVQEFTNLSDIISTDTIAKGGAALLSIGYTDWLKVEGGIRFSNPGTTTTTTLTQIGTTNNYTSTTKSTPSPSSDFGWLASVSGEGSLSADNSAVGKIGYSVNVTNQNTAVKGEFPTELAIGVAYSGLQLGTIRSAGGAIAEPGDVPVFQLGIGGQFVYFLSGDVTNQWMYGVNLATKFLTIIDLGFDLKGTATNPVDAIGLELGVVNPGENVGRIFGLALDFRAENLGGDVERTLASGDKTKEAKLSISPELTLQAGSAGPKFRFGLPIVVDNIEASLIELDVELSF